MNGDRIDHGGNINTLTIYRPSPLAKANPQHSNIGQIARPKGVDHDSVRFPFRRHAVHGLQDVRAGLQGQEGPLHAISFRNVYEYGGGSWKQDDAGAWTCDTYVYHVSVACNHCDSPACMAKCPQGAISRTPTRAS